MQTQQIHDLITRKLRARGLVAHPGKLVFTHKGQAVALTIAETIYRGHFVTVTDQGRKVREFRMAGGEFDWDEMASAVVAVAEGRLASVKSQLRNTDRQLAMDLRAMVANGTSSHLSIEPSPVMPGRLRVKLQELDLDPSSVMQLCATLSRALAAAQPSAMDGDIAAA